MAKISFNKTAAPVADAPAPAKSPAKSPAKVTKIKEKVPTPDPDVEIETETTVAEAPAPTTTAVARRQPSAPPATSSGGAFGDNDSEIDFSEINLPKINLVQKVGGLSEQFEPGEIVLNKELVLPQPMRFAVVGMSKTQYVERVQGGEMGNLFNSVEEVVEAGGTVIYAKAQEADIPWYQRMKRALILIEKHDDVEDEDSFPYEHDGKKYAIAIWTMKGTAFTNAAKALLTARKIGCLKSGYLATYWNATTSIQQFGKNFAAVPAVKSDGKTTEEFRAFAAEVFNGQSDE